ncbi:MAG: nucleotidyltransferase domain-containing protein [Bacillota bacterium]|nr:nucleotidyltransferase domain-containing protein [Bacillota bacterium]
MRDWLLKLETEYDVDILFACEAGSRAWGNETSQSDYDIRFIFRYKDAKKYLSLRKWPETLDFQIPFDSTGFDIYKTFHLMLKSNPTIFEIAFSPTIYIEKVDFSTSLQELIQNGYSLYSLIKHYGSLKKRNLMELSKGDFDFKKQKKLIQALRADLICEGMIEVNKVQSPFLYLENAKRVSPAKYQAYQNITNAKRNNILISTTEYNDLINLLEISKGESLAEKQERNDQLQIKLDKWLWEIVGLQ